MTIRRSLTGFLIICIVCVVAVSVSDAQERRKPPAVQLTGQDENGSRPLANGGQRDIILVGDREDRGGQQLVRSEQGEMERGPSEHGYRSRLMMMWNLVDYLNLDEETAADFFPIFNDYTQKREKLTETHRALAEQIIANVDKESFSLGNLKNLVQKLEDSDEALRKERAAFFSKTKKILNDRQYIKLVIFNDKLKKDLFNRYTSKRKSSRMPEGADRQNADQRRPGQNIDKEKIEELQKMLDQQQREIERQQKQIEKLLKEK